MSRIVHIEIRADASSAIRSLESAFLACIAVEFRKAGNERGDQPHE